MTDDVPGPDLEEAVAIALTGTQPNWTCRGCLAELLDRTLRTVKIALLRLARFRGRNYIETACTVCEGCGETTAVVRLSRREPLRRLA